MTDFGWDRTSEGWIKPRSESLIFHRPASAPVMANAAARSPTLAMRIDESAQLIRSVGAARAMLAVLGALASSLMLPVPVSAFWLGGALAAEAWAWFATRALAPGKDITWTARANFIANYMALNLCWVLLAVLLWRTGTPAGQASAAAMFLAIAAIFLLLIHSAPAVFLVAGTLPAAGALTVFALATGRGWRDLLAVGLMLGLATIFNLGRALGTPSVQEQQRWLGDSLKSYELLAENITDVITRVDASGVCRYVSPGCLSMLGYRDDELVGTNLAALLDPEGAQAATAAFSKLTADGTRSEVITARARYRDGHWLWLQTSITLIREDGAVTGAIGVSRDVSERVAADVALRKAHEDVAAARDAAISANRTKTNFLGNMSHELRTPLNAILGFAELLSQDAFAGKRAEYAKHIASSGKHLLGLVSELLDLSSIETGQFDLHPEAVALDVLIDDCLATVGPAARAGAVTLEKKIPPQLPHVFADPRAITQMTHNLLSNAIKFTGPGGAVRVFAAIATSGELALGVSDTGIGIAESEQAQAFERFGQARHDVANSENGAGLGLPIVKGLAEAHGGRVTLESRLGHGTTVTVWFPVHCVQPRAEEDLPDIRAAG